MGKKIVHLKSEELRNRRDVASFLRDLAQRVQTEQVVLRRGVDEIKLNIPDTVALGLESEEKKKKGKIKHSLEIQIEWTQGGRSGSAVSLG